MNTHTTHHESAAPLFNVTFYNQLASRRGTVIDKVTEAEADAIVARLSNKADTAYYLPEVRKEPA